MKGERPSSSGADTQQTPSSYSSRSGGVALPADRPQLALQVAAVDERARGPAHQRVRGEVRVARRLRELGEQHLAGRSGVGVGRRAGADVGDGDGVAAADDGQQLHAAVAPRGDVDRLARLVRQAAHDRREGLLRDGLPVEAAAQRRGVQAQAQAPPLAADQEALADEGVHEVVGRRQPQALAVGHLAHRQPAVLARDVDEDREGARDRLDARTLSVGGLDAHLARQRISMCDIACLRLLQRVTPHGDGRLAD